MHQNIFKITSVTLLVLLISACGSSPKKSEPIAKPIVVAAPTLTPELQQQFNQGVELLKKRDFRPARAIFQRLIALEPRLAGAYVNLGIISEAEGEDGQAKAYFELAIEHNPHNVYALNYLALEKQKAGLFTDAEALFLQGLVKKPDDEKINFNLGVLYEIYLGENKKAIKHYTRYVRVSKNSNVEKVKRWIKLLERR